MGCKVYTGFLGADLAWSWLQKMETIVITFQISSSRSFHVRCNLEELMWFSQDVLLWFRSMSYQLIYCH